MEIGEYHTQSLQCIKLDMFIYYSTFIHCKNSEFLIGLFVPRDTGLQQNNLCDVIIVV